MASSACCVVAGCGCTFAGKWDLKNPCNQNLQPYGKITFTIDDAFAIVSVDLK